MVHQIWKPIVTPEDFTSFFKCVPEKTALLYSGRSVPHYKACSQIKEEGICELLASFYAAMMTVLFGHTILSGEMEEGRRCHVGKDSGGYTH
jgi:hypothetical protein